MLLFNLGANSILFDPTVSSPWSCIPTISFEHFLNSSFQFIPSSSPTNLTPVLSNKPKASIYL